MTAFYNEIDPYAAQWLRNLIDAGHIAPGVVDTRSIEDITPDELKGYTQVHFFAGIGVWSYALRRAGWPDDRPVWTGSCPCQPFSAAGKGNGFSDERHLWPVMHYLIEQCRPSIVFGEQVASADGLQWLDLVQTDLEATRYAFGAADLCAAGVGAPHIRQRLYWLAYAHNEGSQGRLSGGTNPQRQTVNGYPGCNGTIGGLGYSGRVGRQQWSNVTGSDGTGMVAPWGEQIKFSEASHDLYDETKHPGPINGFWGAADWLSCRDGKFRPVEPGTFPLANGASSRVGRLRAYGNALAAPVAETFISAYMEAANDNDFTATPLPRVS